MALLSSANRRVGRPQAPPSRTRSFQTNHGRMSVNKTLSRWVSHSVSIQLSRVKLIIPVLQILLKIVILFLAKMTKEIVTKAKESKPVQPNKCFTIDYLLSNTENKKRRIRDTLMHSNGSTSSSEVMEPRQKKEKLTQMVQPMPRVQTIHYQVIPQSKPKTVPVPVPTSVSSNSCSERDSNSASDEEVDILYEDDEDDQSPPTSPGESNKGDPGKLKKSKRRILFTKEQIEVLERKFYSNKYVTACDRDQLARELNLSPNQIKIWFQNHRYKTKKLGDGFEDSVSQLANHIYLSQHNYSYNRGHLPGIPLEYTPYLDPRATRIENLRRIAASPEFNLASRACSFAAAAPLHSLPLPHFPHVVNLGPYYHPRAYYPNAFQEGLVVHH